MALVHHKLIIPARSLCYIFLPHGKELNKIKGLLRYDCQSFLREVLCENYVLFHVDTGVISRHSHALDKGVHGISLLIKAPLCFWKMLPKIVDKLPALFDCPNNNSHIENVCEQ